MDSGFCCAGQHGERAARGGCAVQGRLCRRIVSIGNVSGVMIEFGEAAESQPDFLDTVDLPVWRAHVVVDPQVAKQVALLHVVLICRMH